MSQVVAKFLSDVGVHFPMRHESSDRETLWVKAMVRELKKYSAPVLARAAQTLIDTRTDRRFPLVSEIHAACKEAMKSTDAATGAPKRWGEGMDIMDPVSFRHAVEQQEERYRKAAEWRKKVCEEYGDMDTYLSRTARGRTNRGTAKPIGGIMPSIVQSSDDAEELP